MCIHLVCGFCGGTFAAVDDDSLVFGAVDVIELRRGELLIVRCHSCGEDGELWLPWPAPEEQDDVAAHDLTARRAHAARPPVMEPERPTRRLRGHG